MDNVDLYERDALLLSLHQRKLAYIEVSKERRKEKAADGSSADWSTGETTEYGSEDQARAQREKQRVKKEKSKYVFG